MVVMWWVVVNYLSFDIHSTHFDLTPCKCWNPLAKQMLQLAIHAVLYTVITTTTLIVSYTLVTLCDDFPYSMSTACPYEHDCWLSIHVLLMLLSPSTVSSSCTQLVPFLVAPTSTPAQTSALSSSPSSLTPSLSTLTTCCVSQPVFLRVRSWSVPRSDFLWAGPTL